ncbi:type II toxin-antitoxin system RelE/ParE family toxin [Candidatus Poribacteria bacterium]|nr:type II toxin-antitoxin system RelE/ParE family toxin [Candidatus Poribacteria bacterium]
MWKIKISKNCLKELTRVPQHIRRQFEEIFLSSDDVENPFDYQEFGAWLEKLRGEENCYKVRIGDWRVGIFLNKEERILQVVTIFHRGTEYRSFP